jgi:hypothetical protein
MKPQFVPRDERTTAVENASYRWAYLLLSYGLLLSVAYRGFVRHESAWDLLALVLLGGVVTTLYQGRHQVLSMRWVLLMLLTLLVAGVLAAVVVVLR